MIKTVETPEISRLFRKKRTKGAVGDQEVDMVACHLPGENGQFMFHRNLAD